MSFPISNHTHGLQEPFANKAERTAATDSLSNRDTFLQLLVAQIRNQDPLNPAQGTEFLAQLAQFSGLEQTIQLRDEVGSVRQAVEALTEVVRQGPRA